MEFNSLSKIIPPDRILVDEPMSRHTSFKIGGPADFLVLPNSPQEIAGILAECRNNGTDFIILGHGSNLLVPDEGLRAVVIKLEKFDKIHMNDEKTLTADAGVALSKLSNFAKNHRLAGAEFLSGIPGSMGGAVYMNGGAYGHEIADIFRSCEVMSVKDGQVHLFRSETMQFDYRTSLLQADDWILLNASISLKSGNPEEIAEYMNELNRVRREKQPLEFPNAGSIFKRPPNNFAGKLIADCGLKGMSVGGAKVSEKHAGFIVNTGGATANDVVTLIERIQATVLEQYGINLETEVKILCNS
ncbi:MAG: UDP-N-acetylmuramate dehydrogenase [Turicibacter sp.]|nr:UDP-N-acetylmuramate dehydrogenase [Turicibacter sp.]